MMQRLQSRRRAFLDRIGDGKDRGERVINRDEHDRCTFGLMRTCLLSARVGTGHALFVKQVRFANHDLVLTDSGMDTATRDAVEIARLSQLQIVALCSPDNRLSKRMFTLALDGRSHPQHVAFTPVTECLDRCDFRSPLRQCPRLVDDDRINLLHQL